MRQWQAGLRRGVGAALIDRIERDDRQSDMQFRRRRIVTAATLVAGAVLLGISLAQKPGSVAFYPLTVSIAVVYIVGAFASGPLHVGWTMYGGKLRRPTVVPILIGLLAAAVFILGALVVREIPLLRHVIDNILDHARKGNIWLVLGVTVLNGIGEELFYRGALFAAIGRRAPVAISTVMYVLVTAASGNLMLMFAAVVMGAIFALQRRASGGVLASTLTHLVWSPVMLIVLPPLLAR